MLDFTTGKVGIVVIGRNEGERLRICLQSVMQSASKVVYVDSGSTDESLSIAKSYLVPVHELDMSVPFTAARARNAGVKFLTKKWPAIKLIQFIDGDCELLPGWLVEAEDFLLRHPGYAVVSGRLHERYPRMSIYNRLCDLEWNAAAGDVATCGGIAMIRLAAFNEVRGFNPSLIAGEEPDLCLRLRRKGWRIHRLSLGMAYHDAAIQHFFQWWRRSIRGGYAFAEGAWMHGTGPERHWVRETMSAVFWGAVIPVFAIVCGALVSPSMYFALLLYPMQVIKLSIRYRDFLRALLVVVCKFSEFLGVVRFFRNKLLNIGARLIEYK